MCQTTTMADAAIVACIFGSICFIMWLVFRK